jgi:hypothetical protein
MEAGRVSLLKPHLLNGELDRSFARKSQPAGYQAGARTLVYFLLHPGNFVNLIGLKPYVVFQAQPRQWFLTKLVLQVVDLVI